MREVEVDALDVRMLGGDLVAGGAGATTDVDEHLDVVEAAVDLDQLLHEDGRVAPHALGEKLVVRWIGALALEQRHPVGLLEGGAALQHRFLPGVTTIIAEAEPIFRQLLVREETRKSS